MNTGYENIKGRPGSLPYEPHELDGLSDDRVKATVAHLVSLYEKSYDEAVKERENETCD